MKRMNRNQSPKQMMNVRSNNANSYLNSLKAMKGTSSSVHMMGKRMPVHQMGMNHKRMQQYSPTRRGR